MHSPIVLWVRTLCTVGRWWAGRVAAYWLL